MNALNGHKKVLGIAAAIATVLQIITAIVMFYAGWTQKVEASVTDRRMLNAHDETLKMVVPKVETCHTINEIQQIRMDRNERDIASVIQALAKTNDNLEKTREIVQAYVQGRMRSGEVPR